MSSTVLSGDRAVGLAADGDLPVVARRPLKIYAWTLGPESPASIAAFARDIFTTHAGRTLIGVGVLFALLVLTIGIVSSPLLLDREGVSTRRS